MKTSNFLPALDWARRYTREDLRSDVVAGIVVFFITVPQVIAYAFLAGLPPEVGLYAAILALVAYAAFGSSRTLAVGPTAIIAMMTLESVSGFADPHTREFAETAVKLAFVTGVFLIVLRLINFGSVISFLSHGVVTGFITAAAILIMMNQLPPLIGVGSPSGTTIDVVVPHLAVSLTAINGGTLAIAIGAIAILLFCQLVLGRILRRTGLSSRWIDALVRLAPMYAVILGVGLGAMASVAERYDVDVVGSIPSDLPVLAWVGLTVSDAVNLLPSALLISMLVFMESVSVGTAVAGKRRQKIDPNQELVGLGMSNIGSAFAGGFPVAGSFARTVVNFSSGAVTPVASLVTAMLVFVSLVGFAPLFHNLPKAVLSVIILLSAAQLIDRHGIRKIFEFNAIDGITFAATFIAVLVFGVELGIVAGILISFVLLIRASSRPHIAVVGRWHGTEHFRNVLRHEVATSPKVLAVRIDESLYFVNTRYIETFLLNHVAESSEIEHVLLICTATNFIDSSGLEMLENLSDNLAEVGVTLHLSEVKGPVMDRLKQTDFYERMSGKVFFTTDIAMKELAGV